MPLLFHKVTSPGQRAELIGRQVYASINGDEMVALRGFVIREILGGCRDRDDLCQLAAIFGWVKSHIRYVEECPAFDFYPTARVVLELGGGDCDCHTILICAFASSIGFPVGATVIRPRDGEFHVYPVAFVPKSKPVQVCPLDTTWPGGGKPGVEYPPELCSYRRTFYFDLRPGAAGRGRQEQRRRYAGVTR